MKIRYGNDIAAFLAKVNPSTQLEICANTHDCFMGNYPTLRMLRMAYGSEAPKMWLLPQLYNLSEYCGVRNKLEGNPLLECATIIANTFDYLKTSELMLFFYNFKSAKYGKFYGNVDPMVIMSSLRSFISDRHFFNQNVENYERQKAIDERAKNAISYEEYCKKNGIEPKKEIQMLAENKEIRVERFQT